MADDLSFGLNLDASDGLSGIDEFSRGLEGLGDVAGRAAVSVSR